MTALSVNVNKIAWLRNSREGARPSVLAAARTAIAAGAHGVTVHPRPDRRHVRPADVEALAALLAAEAPHAEFNVEGNPAAGPRGNGYPGFDRLIETARPHQATLVPDADAQLTSDHGWDLSDPAAARRVRAAAARYRDWGVRVSLFMDPVEEQIAPREGLRRGPRRAVHRSLRRPRRAPWTGARGDPRQPRLLRLRARYAAELGLGVNAGHDLDLDNLAAFVAIGGIAEVSIGHALIADALEVGLSTAVRRYLDAIAAGESGRSSAAPPRRR